MELQTVPISKVVQLENSRGKHEEADLASLMSSIKTVGLQQPIGVREISGGKFEIVFGNRRYEAMKKLGEKKIPIITVEASSQKEFLLLNLIENAQRSDITVYGGGWIGSEYLLVHGRASVHSLSEGEG